MKKLLIVLMFLPLLGCASLSDMTNPDIDIELYPGEINWDDVGSMILIKSTASALGYFIGKSGNPDIEQMIAIHYAEIKAGRIDMIALNIALDYLTTGTIDPIVRLLVMNVLDAAGAIFVQGELIKLELPEEVWAAAEVSYQLGLEIGKAELQ